MSTALSRSIARLRAARPSFVLARLAGAQAPVLREAPGDAVKQAAMGGVLLTTAAVAGVSSAFALNTAVDLPLLPSIVVGVLWAWVIFNLDRMLVVTMSRAGGWWRILLTALPRVLLAVVIGAVISAPLVLRIFQPEIDAELQVMRNERYVASQERLAERFAAIPELERQEAELQGIVSGQTRPSVDADPEVSRLQAEFDAKDAEYLAAEQLVVCENDGTCGTGEVGRGPSYRERVEIRDRLRNERNALRNQLDDAISAAQERIGASTVVQRDAAAVDLARVRGELEQLRTEQAGARAAVANAEENSDGLLARLEALHRLSADRTTMLIAHLALGLLFMLLELLPVISKTMGMLGPATHYERLVTRQETTLEGTFNRKLKLRTRQAAMRDDIAVQIDKDRAAAQIDAGKQANQLLVDKQSEIARHAIDVWGQIATSRSDDELKAWYARVTGGQALQPATVPIPVPVPRPAGAGPAAPSAVPTPPGPAGSPVAGPAGPGPLTGAGGYARFKASMAASGGPGPQHAPSVNGHGSP